MKITLNGKIDEMEENMDIYSMLKSKGYNPARVVVQLNDENVAKRDWKNVTIKENDTIEIISIISGG